MLFGMFGLGAVLAADVISFSWDFRCFQVTFFSRTERQTNTQS
jgi:hypothetical protein